MLASAAEHGVGHQVEGGGGKERDFPRAGKRARLGVMLTRHTHILSAPGKEDSHGSRHADGV